MHAHRYWEVCAAPHLEVGGQVHKGGGRTGGPDSLSSLSPHPEGVGRGMGEAGLGRATSLCPTPRSLDKTPVGNVFPQHCHVLNFLTQKDIINIGVGNIHIIQKCKGHTTIFLSPWPRPPESLPHPTHPPPRLGSLSPGSRAGRSSVHQRLPCDTSGSTLYTWLCVGLFFFFLKAMLGDCSVSVQTENDVKNEQHRTHLLGIHSLPGTAQNQHRLTL